MQRITEKQALASAINLFVKLKARKLQSVVIYECKSLFTHDGRPGWNVSFKFEEPDCFLNSNLTIEVDESGAAKVYESL